jgi:hypothetical protein
MPSLRSMWFAIATLLVLSSASDAQTPQRPSKVLPVPQAPSKVLPVPQAPSKILPVAQAPSKALPSGQFFFSCPYKHYPSGENRSCDRTDTHSGSDQHYCAVHGYTQQSGWQ